MCDEKLFTNAVQLAAAFVANGDIRCGKSFREDTDAMNIISTIVPSIYTALEDAKQTIEEKSHKG